MLERTRTKLQCSFINHRSWRMTQNHSSLRIWKFRSTTGWLGLVIWPSFTFCIGFPRCFPALWRACATAVAGARVPQQADIYCYCLFIGSCCQPTLFNSNWSQLIVQQWYSDSPTIAPGPHMILHSTFLDDKASIDPMLKTLYVAQTATIITCVMLVASYQSQ